MPKLKKNFFSNQDISILKVALDWEGETRSKKHLKPHFE
jgi:hypothetical protein